jgi:hypothetical protein
MWLSAIGQEPNASCGQCRVREQSDSIAMELRRFVFNLSICIARLGI